MEGKGEFNSDDHYIYYCGQESHRRNGVALIINKRVQNAVLGCSTKNDRMIILQSSKSMPQPLIPKKLKVNGSMRPTRISRTNTKNRYPFHHKELECKSS